MLTGLKALHELGLNPLIIVIKETRVPQFADEFIQNLPSNIESITIESNKALDFKLPKKLNAVLNNICKEHPVVLHSHGFKALIACGMVRKNIPHVHTHHGDTSHTFKVRMYEKIARITMKSCDEVIAVSFKMRNELEKILKPFYQITVVENMLSLDNANEIRRKRRVKYESGNNDKVELIFIGRLSPEKGLLPFLKCFSKFPQKTSFHLTVLGDGNERLLVEKFIEENDLTSLVILHGFVTDPTSFIASADILIMPSLREGLPMTLIEALSSGLPIIANDVGAISSLVTQKHNGFLAKDSSIESWNEVLDETLKFHVKWRQNAMFEAENISDRFSTKQWANKTLEIYQGTFKKSEKIILKDLNFLKIYRDFAFDHVLNISGKNFLKPSQMFQADVIIINIDQRRLLFIAALKWLLPFWRVRLVSVDILLRPVATGIKAKLIAAIKKLLLLKVDLFLLYFKNTNGYQREYGLPPERIAYVPFKVNSWEKLKSFPDRELDGDYVLCAGRTLRDIQTFLSAMEKCKLPGVLLLQDSETMSAHGTFTRGLSIPSNVKIEIHSDGLESTYLNWIAGARLVVVPRFQNDIASTGISTYLCAMALKRCVLISYGPGAEDVLVKGEAIFFQSGDIQSLSELMEKAWTQKDFRHNFIEAGFIYASTLGGEERLLKNILETSVKDKIKRS